ncbi:glutaminyl-peptide cyclotransferase [Mucilaginibacter sp. BJC16-A38]|uniref:glutaminyl-peptide cyclotransferase n=1 Tax=Mucilaginibacter phenanthrenivorans TaxID=1234842 RepID=UPI0021573253|nr:glutaminyl-peptide cyclotransferase [Mucilaginibacter phenanthrenivorans]MCR8557534.1 glutaminyl-peptide cyclotransferase [Mucilaginibacter phenanthrenivorans]
MKFKFKITIATACLFAFGCTPKSQDNGITISPEAGSSYKTGDVVNVQAHAAGSKPDSIVYLLDSVKVGSKKDTTVFALKTDTLPLGPRVITAKVYTAGKNQDVSTNIVLLPAKAPVEYTYKVDKVFPHDTSCYTEGLLYEDGFLYESGGGYLTPPLGQEVTGQSSLRKVDLNTGKPVQKVMNDPKVFGEGISIVDDKIIQLTYLEKIGYVYDKKTFKLLSTFTNNVGIEGWGMCFDGKKLYMDDKTNRIYFLDKNNYRQIGYIDVYDDKGAVNEVNELEYIDGKLYANVYKTNNIIVIDPKTGAVLQKIDLTSLYPEDKRAPNADVLNGIAYDAATKRIFITGKKWPHLYQVSFVKK